MGDQANQFTVIGQDTTIKGEVTFERAARILGTIEGKVITPGELQVGPTARCRTSIEAGAVIVEGTIEGDIVARERIQLNGTARVQGDVVAEKLIVAEGASFSGHCRVGPDAAQQPRTATTPPSSTHAHTPDTARPAAGLTTPLPRNGPKFEWVGQPVAIDATPRPAWTPQGQRPGFAEGAA